MADPRAIAREIRLAQDEIEATFAQISEAHDITFAEPPQPKLSREKSALVYMEWLRDNLRLLHERTQESIVDVDAFNALVKERDDLRALLDAASDDPAPSPAPTPPAPDEKPEPKAAEKTAEKPSSKPAKTRK